MNVSIPKWCDYKKHKVILSILYAWFQFQNGAIISIIHQALQLQSNAFQFQNGAIISDPITEILTHLASFNSKMVRL